MLKTLSRFLFGTLRGRLILGVAIVHAVMMALFISDLTLRQRTMLLDRQIEEAAALSQALATSAAGWISSDDISGLQELVDAQRRYPEILFVILVDEEGRVLADTDKSRLGQYLLDLPHEARQTVLSRTPAMVDVAVPAMIGERHVGWARIGMGQKAAGEKLAGIIRNGIFYALAAILIGSVIAWFMGRQITRRLYAVQETIDAVRSGNRLARSSIVGTDEPAVMAHEFNSMLDMIVQRDAELHASEEKYRLLIQKVQTAIVLHDGQGRILDSNPLACQLLGFSEDWLLGKELNVPEWHFLREDGSVLPVAEYPVNLVISAKKPLRGYVTGIQRPDRDDVTWVLVNAEPEYNNTGEIIRVLVSFVDISERKRVEEKLRRIEWLLTKSARIETDLEYYIPSYGNLTDINTERTILNSVGESVLKNIAEDYIGLLGTSGAIYEKNGDYALGIFASGWCRFLDSSSRKLCETDDNQEALSGGKWLCHESCWTKASKAAIETGKPADIECYGGIHLYAVPIVAEDEIIGSINVGYGDPPKDTKKLQEIADRYSVSLEEIVHKAHEYESRPLYIVELAKKRLHSTAKLIAEIVVRKRAERQLTLVDFALNHVRDAAFLINENAHFHYVNDEACRVLGYTRAELLGLGVSEIDPDFPLERWPNHWNNLKMQHSLTFEGRHRTKDGRIFPVEVSANYFEFGGQAYNLALVRDITERKRAAEALETERKRMEIILSAQNTGLSLINPDMTIAWVNPKIREMFPGREPVGQVCHVFYESRATICESCGTQQAFMNGKVCESEQFIPAIGRWYYIISQPIKDTAGRVENVLEGITDITERKRGEEKLRQNLSELQRWHDVTLDREDRVQELKAEVNQLVTQLGEPPRYTSQI